MYLSTPAPSPDANKHHNSNHLGQYMKNACYSSGHKKDLALQLRYCPIMSVTETAEQCPDAAHAAKRTEKEIMTQEIKIEVAGVCISLTSASPEFIECVRENYALFLSDSPSSLILDISLTQETYINDSSWAGLAIMGDTLRLSDNYLESKIELSLQRGSALISRSGLTIGLSTLLRNMCTLLLLFKENAIILHAAALVRDDRVYVFLGRSGSGKTTVSCLSEDCTVLSDDMTIVKEVHGTYHVFPSPFWLDMQRGDRENRGYEIGGIFTLIQDERTYLKKILPAQAMADIFTVPHIPAEMQPVQKLFDSFINILSKHDLYELHFRKDKSFWRHIDKLTEQIPA